MFKFFKVFFGLVFILFLLLLLPFFIFSSSFAAESDIQITEIMSDPEGSDTDFEWFEIYNASLDPITIIGGNTALSWKILDGTYERSLLETAFQGDMVLNSETYAIIARNPAMFLTRYPDYDGDLIQVNSLSLNNSGDTLGLKIVGASDCWNEVIYDTTWELFPSHSLEKIDLTLPNTSENWTRSLKFHGTPGKPYVPNQSPIAQFKTSNDEYYIQEEIEFDGSSSSDTDSVIVSYSWDFGDGNDFSSSESSVTHFYDTPDSYEITLTVTDDYGAEDSIMKKVKILEPEYSSDIILSEILPDPGEETDWDSSGVIDYKDEWVELFNQGKTEVDLTNWILDDEEGGSSPCIFPSGTKIKALSYLVIYHKESGLSFNNDEDSIRLFHPNSDLVEEFSYSETDPDAVYAKDAKGNWQSSLTPTPNSLNKITIEDPDDSDDSDDSDSDTDSEEKNNYQNLELMTISKARSAKLDSVILIQGILIATPEILGSQIVYLQDNSAGIKVKLLESDYSTLALGDEIKISGLLKESYNEKYLKMTDDSIFTIISHQSPMLPQLALSGELDESFEGELVYINGVITSTSGNTYYIDDGSGIARIYIKDTTDIEKPKMKKGNYSLTVGIVSQYEDSYRILPRYQNDIIVSKKPIVAGTVLGAKTLPQTGKRSQTFGLLAFIVSLLIRICLARRQA